MIDTYKKLIRKLKKDYPKISEEQINSTIRHIRAIMGEWKLKVQSDIYEYLAFSIDEFSIDEEKRE